jgi:MFS family permease
MGSRTPCPFGGRLVQVGLVAAVYPAVWASRQIATGAWSDKIGRKPLVVAGMLLQGVALGVLAIGGGSVAIATITAVFTGLGTALVYPTLIPRLGVRARPAVGIPVHRRDLAHLGRDRIADQPGCPVRACWQRRSCTKATTACRFMVF